MAFSTVRTSTKKRFLRYVYLEGAKATRADIVAAGVTADTAEARQVVIATECHAGFSDSIRGKQLSSASANGKSTAFAAANGISAEDINELAEWAEGFIAEATIEEALALVPPPVIALRTDFSGVRL